MNKPNAANERIKHEYLSYLEQAKQLSAASAENAAAAISLFEESTNYKDFSAFHIEQAKRFKRFLEQARHPSTGRPWAKATVHSRLLAVKAFFIWLAGQPGYKSRVSYPDCDYFNPSANDARIADARNERDVPTLEQIRHVLSLMPSHTAIEKRDRAIVAFTILSGARDNAIASFNLGHVDLVRRTVHHDARTVRTKNRKSMTTSFFPVGEDIEGIVGEWVHFLRAESLFGETDPLFPATLVAPDGRGAFAPQGLARKHWTTADPIRKLFRRAFEGAGLRYCNPHSFRKTLALLGQSICSGPEEMKAWSQNLGHEAMMTTFTSYGTIPRHRQAEILNGLASTSPDGAIGQGAPPPETIEWVMAYIRRMMKGAE